jgi:predicted ATPase
VPFVGRDREWSELEAGLEAALGGRGAFFLITGEGGIGKTRLAEELAEAAAARADGPAGDGAADRAAGLKPGEVEALVAAHAGRPPPPDLVERLQG